MVSSLSFIVLGCLGVLGVHGHDTHSGDCPNFPPMQGFDWDRFMEGRWYATEKFGTTQLKCLTYNFGEDEDGFKYVEQHSVLAAPKNIFSLDNKFKYKGRLTAPYSANPAQMIARFPLNVFGTASYVVLDTDYDSYGLLCTCQAKDIIAWTVHRRSCTILQRDPIRNMEISEQLHTLLNAKVIDSSESEPVDHDFDVISHHNCDYNDNGKGLQIDVDKILGGTKEEIVDTVAEVAEIADDLAGKVFGDGDDDDGKEELVNNLPLKSKDPKV